MKRTKRVFSSAFKAEVALEAIKGVKTVSELAQKYELHPAGPSRARTCDHLIMSQMSNTYNNTISNHMVNINKSKGYELSATIPAIAQTMYGIYRT